MKNARVGHPPISLNSCYLSHAHLKENYACWLFKVLKKYTQTQTEKKMSFGDVLYK